jgi:uncharacterized protein with NRDE domain
MCTLFFRHRPEDEFPLAILSNRDEQYGRPSEGWDWRGPGPGWFAPIDLEAGGTWIGLNRGGVVAALTNIFPGREDAGFRSRGALVTDMLRLGRAADAPAAMADTFANHAYNKFNLLVADPVTAFVFTWDGKTLETFDLRPGVYEVNNIAFDGIEKSNPGVANERWLEREEGRLTEHPLVCRHGEGYGTRCSHKLLIHRDGVKGSVVWHLEGHPCEGRFQRVLGEPRGTGS